MKRILVIAYKYPDHDPRILREVQALLDDGYVVDMICPESPDGEHTPPPDGVRIHSTVMTRQRGSKFRYMFEYLQFLLFSFFKCTALHRQHRYAVIQVFAMPEVLVLSTLVARLCGAKVLLDWEDPSREVFLSKFEGRSSGMFLMAIGLTEKLAAAVAHRIIVPNEGFRRAFADRGIKREKIDIVMNSPDTTVFPQEPTRTWHPSEPDSPVLLHHGLVVERSGLDIAIRALPTIVATLPNLQLRFVDEGPFAVACLELAAKLGVGDRVKALPGVFVADIPAMIDAAHVGIVTNRSTPFTRINFPTRIMEFALMRRPIVAPRLPGVLDYVDDEYVYFFTPDDPEDFASRVLEVFRDMEEADRRVEHAHRWHDTVSWDGEKAHYLQILGHMSGASTATSTRNGESKD